MPDDGLVMSKWLPDLTQRPEAPMEWWFVQGILDGPVCPQLYFMAAFFQVRLGNSGAPAAQMLLVHILDGDGTPRHIVSRITPDIVDAHRSIAARVIETRFPRRFSNFLLHKHMGNVHQNAKAGGIEIDRARAHLADNVLDIDWRDFTLCETRDGFQLTLPMGSEGAAGHGLVELGLEPVRHWMCETGDRLMPGRSSPYSYYSCPRLKVTGSVDGHAVTGRAWFDRQWGHTLDSWFTSESSGELRLLGWDWLGLSLDNGIDVLAVQPTLAGEEPYGSGYVICLDDDGARKIDGSFPSIEGRRWTSHHSGTDYPVQRRLLLPDLDAEFSIDPVALDQEIPVFGAPAIWEGAVSATGRMNGKPIGGFGRLELFGYGYEETISRALMRRLRRALSI